MDTILSDFTERLASFDGSDEAALMIGRWTANARPDISYAGTAEQAAAAESIERAYYRAGDGDAPVSELVAAIESAASEITP